MSREPTAHETGDGDGDHAVNQRERDADEREGALNAREARIGAREASRARRLEDARGIRAAADERDTVADGRDWNANKRDMAASARSWVNEDDKDGKARADRETAYGERTDAKADRLSSAVDRGLLTDDDDPRDGEALESRPSS